MKNKLFFVMLSISSLAACEERPPAATTPDEPAAVATQPPENTPRTGSFVLANLDHEIASGQESVLRFEVKPGKDLKINPEYPWKFTLDEPVEHVAFAGDLVLKKDAMDVDASRALIPVTLTTSADGSYEVRGSLNLSVCEKGDEARCLWFTDEPVTLRVKAKSEPND